LNTFYGSKDPAERERFLKLADLVLPGPESADHPPEEIPERHENLIGKAGIQLFARSFILQVYDVLARHTTADDNDFV
jgi:hypothetical protein